MPSAQVITSPVLRQFAVAAGLSIEVSTKLGHRTLVRATFLPGDFPSDEELQTSFLKSLADRACPGALDILDSNMTQCLEDQAQAVRTVIQAISTTLPN